MAAFFARVKTKKDATEPGAERRRTPGAEVIYADRAGEVTQPRTGKTMAPKFMGGAGAGHPAGPGPPRGAWPSG